MTRVLVISGDILPYPGFPTTGAGLRAWGIGKGLETRGYDVLLAMPKDSVKKIESVPEQIFPLLYTQQELPDFIARHQPDVVVLQHWWLAKYLQDSPEFPLVIDFHGPLLLETQFQDNPALETLRQDKIEALHKADYFTCAGEKQRYYFLPWLLLAGFDLREDIIHTIPVSLSPEIPEHQSQGEISFVYGGVFLPWQDPTLGLQTLVETLERHNTGLLKFFGGKHPVVTVPTGNFENLREQLQQSPRVHMQPMIPRDELIREYYRSHVAIDIMQKNVERELAFTTRTVEYLWCGLPVIYNDYAELAGYIRDYEAGWTLDPRDKEALQQTLEDILREPDLVTERGKRAQQLVRERLTWETTIDPLDRFCQAPVKRKKAEPLCFSAGRSSIKQVAYYAKKIQFHIKHEGVADTLNRIWGKLRQ